MPNMARKRKREREKATLEGYNLPTVNRQKQAINAENFIKQEQWSEWYTKICSVEAGKVKKRIKELVPSCSAKEAMKNLITDGNWKSKTFCDGNEIPVDNLKIAAEETFDAASAKVCFSVNESSLLKEIESSVGEIMVREPETWFYEFEKKKGATITHEVKYEASQYLHELVQPVYDQLQRTEFCLKV